MCTCIAAVTTSSENNQHVLCLSVFQPLTAFDVVVLNNSSTLGLISKKASSDLHCITNAKTHSRHAQDS